MSESLLPSASIAEVERAWRYASGSARLRSASTWSILFGALAIAMGASSLRGGPLNAILAVLGVLLLAEGVWLRLTPSTRAPLVDAIAVMVVGVWNMVVPLANASSYSYVDAQLARYIAMLGVWQIGMGITALLRYRDFARAAKDAPTVGELQRLAPWLFVAAAL